MLLPIVFIITLLSILAWACASVLGIFFLLRYHGLSLKVWAIIVLYLIWCGVVLMAYVPIVLSVGMGSLLPFFQQY